MSCLPFETPAIPIPVFSALVDLSELPLFPSKEVLALQAAGFRCGSDVLGHLPKRYEDRRRFDRFPTQATATPICLRGMVIDTSRRQFGKGSGFYEAVIMNGEGGLFGSGKSPVDGSTCHTCNAWSPPDKRW